MSTSTSAIAGSTMSVQDLPITGNETRDELIAVVKKLFTEVQALRAQGQNLGVHSSVQSWNPRLIEVFGQYK